MNGCARERRLFPPSRVFVPTDRRKTPRRARHCRRHSRARPRVTPTTRSTRSRGRAVHERGCCVPPHRRVTTRHVPPSRRGLHVIPSHPIPSHPTHIHIAFTRVDYETKNPESHPIRPPLSRVPPWGDGDGGVRTHESRPVNQCTHAHRRMTRGLTRDVMTTDTLNHTSTTTIASSRALDRTRAFSTSSSSSRSGPLARAPPVGTDVAGRHTSTDRSRDARTRRRRIRSRIAIASTRRRTSPTTAFERIHCIRAFFPRIFARIRRTRARIRRARDERGGESTSREIARVRLTRGA